MTRRRLALLPLLLVTVLLSSCASLIGPREVDIPLARLQAGLERRFPRDDRLLAVFDVRLSRPQLFALADQDRLGLALEADIAPPLLRRGYHAGVQLSGRLALDAARGAVFMDAPQVDRLSLDGVDPATQRQLARLGELVMDRVVRDLPLYTFRMEDLRYGGVQFVPTRLQVTPAGLRVSLEPLK